MGQNRVDLVVKNGKLLWPKKLIKGGIAIDNGIIVAVAKEPNLPKGDLIVDAKGKVIFPGILDCHSHTTLLPEDSCSGTRAAAKGGFTTILEMPGTEMGGFNPEEFKIKRDLYESTSYVDFCIHVGCASGYPNGNLTELWNLGATGVKFFVSNAGPNWPQTYDGEIIDRFTEIASFNGLAMIHAENDQILVDNRKKLQSDGRKDYAAHLEWRPPISEAECGARIIRYLRATGCRGLIVHTSLPETVSNVQEARASGVEVFVETCPQYLYLTEEDVLKKGPWAKFAPPARTKETVKELWALLRKGHIDTIATDHAPYSKEAKLAGIDDIMAAPNGIPGLETFLPLLLTGVNESRLSLERLRATTSENPARIFGVYPRKGSFNLGSDGDLTIVDLKEKWKIKSDDLITACGWTPYDGWDVQGRPTDAFVRGEAILENGEVVSAPGYGVFIGRL